MNTKAKTNKKSIIDGDNIWLSVVRMSIPTMIGLLTISLIYLSDTIMASGASGSEAGQVNAGIGLAMSVIAIVTSLATLITSGSSIRFTFLLGEGREESAKYTAGTSFTTSLMAVVLIALVITPMASSLISMQSGTTSGAIFDSGTTYLYMMIAWLPFYIIYNDLSTYMRIEGNYKYTLSIVIASVIVNIFVNFGLLQTSLDPTMAVSLSTLIVNFTKAFVIVIVAFVLNSKGETYLFNSSVYYRPNNGILASVALLGLPMFFRTTILNINNIMIATSFVNVTVPDGASSSYYSETVGVYNQVYSIINNIMKGLMNGAGTIIAFNFGKKNFKKTRSAIGILAAYEVIFSFVLIATSIVIAPELLSLFGITPDSESIYLFRVMTSRLFFLSLSFVTFGFFINTYQITKSYLSVSLHGLILYIPITLIMFATCPPEVAVWSFLIADATYLLLASFSFLHDLFGLEKLYAANELHITNIHRSIMRVRYAYYTSSQASTFKKVDKNLKEAKNTENVEAKVKSTLAAAKEVEKLSKLLKTQMKDIKNYQKMEDKRELKFSKKTIKYIEKMEQTQTYKEIKAKKELNKIIKKKSASTQKHMTKVQKKQTANAKQTQKEFIAANKVYKDRVKQVAKSTKKSQLKVDKKGKKYEKQVGNDINKQRKDALKKAQSGKSTKPHKVVKK